MKISTVETHPPRHDKWRGIAEQRGVDEIRVDQLGIKDGVTKITVQHLNLVLFGVV